ncbi:HNH endonuclease [Bacillus toyonensis]|uniref:HNH endonuclease n=1 Tax=Bacillus toyonensis TaxID=155322 RepID=UPI000BF91DA9|nr:hypothetical protein [Bacillus toyonensis]PFY26216.1 hypothetical protein COL44_11025 [Bacillus toyonensis]
MSSDRWERTISMLKAYASKLGYWPHCQVWDEYAKQHRLSHAKTIREKLGKSWKGVAEEFGFRCVRKKREGKKPSGKRTDLDDKLIVTRYEAGASINEIADSMRCNRETIRGRLKKMGVDTSIGRKRMPIPHKRDDIPNAEIRKLYKEGISAQEIGKKYGASKRLILRRLEQMGIERRQYNSYPHVDEIFLREYYETRRMSAREVAKVGNCNYLLVLKRLKKFGIAVRSEMSDFTVEERKDKFGRKRERHGLWKGGVTPVRNMIRNRLAHLSQEVFRRDRYCCTVCGGKSELHAHHIRPFAEIIDEILEENDWIDLQDEKSRLAFVEVCEKDGRLLELENLTTLCELCHRNEHSENPVEVVHYDILEKEWREFVEKHHHEMTLSEMWSRLQVKHYRIIRYMQSRGLPFAYEYKEWLQNAIQTKRYSEIAKEFHSTQFPCKAEDIKKVAIQLGILENLTDEIFQLYKEKGVAIKTIGKQLGYSPGYIRDILVINGVHIPEREDVELAEEEICFLFKDGITVEGIVKSLDLPRPAVRRILLRNGYNTSANRMIRHQL